MTNPLTTLLTEMAAELDWSQQLLDEAFRMGNRKATHPLADRARALLDQHPEAEGPTVKELVNHVGWFADEVCLENSSRDIADSCRELIARWGHSTPEAYQQRAIELIEGGVLQRLAPVAVSERPWERDGWCDDEGRYWMGGPW
jgi:hypothetical protein